MLLTARANSSYDLVLGRFWHVLNSKTAQPNLILREIPWPKSPCCYLRIRNSALEQLCWEILADAKTARKRRMGCITIYPHIKIRKLQYVKAFRSKIRWLCKATKRVIRRPNSRWMIKDTQIIEETGSNYLGKLKPIQKVENIFEDHVNFIILHNFSLIQSQI